jgi:hypothetical protein
MSGVYPDSVPNGVLRVVDEVDWSAYAMPPSGQWYRPADVPAAFRRLVTASTQEEARRAYDDMLFAVGNNHAGCLYPAAAPAAPLLVRVVREQQGWSCWAALEILIEFLLFDVDREEFVESTGTTTRVKDVILAAVRSLYEYLEWLTQQRSTVPIAKSARDLLDQLDKDQLTR